MNIIHDKNNNRFTTVQDGETAYVEYILHEDSLALTQTIVPEKISKQGIGTALVKHAFEYAAAHHLVIKPYCSFVVSFLNKNKAYQKQLKKG